MEADWTLIDSLGVVVESHQLEADCTALAADCKIALSAVKIAFLHIVVVRMSKFPIVVMSVYSSESLQC